MPRRFSTPKHPITPNSWEKKKKKKKKKKRTNKLKISKANFEVK